MNTNKTHIATILDDLFVAIPEGKVEMRDDRIEKKWSETILAFELAKFPVTQELYQMVIGENPSVDQHPNKPVESVSWVDALKFCNALSELFDLTPCYTIVSESDITFDISSNGYRLPTEAEWQYACQEGTNAIRYGELDAIAWYVENSGRALQEVGQKTSNRWGLFDMLGNTWEWCSDVYDETVYGSYRVLRGGGWCDEERSVMATTRRRSHPVAFKIDDLGFRIGRNGA
ncbi:MAG: SUMF1/EgtB/PvdO family nonheme iron enzyme [Flavobacteriales bacterium]|nr:SUMF1/EgtB/PvdO family nonheme iron enzyme [Flavobacteriales bacterium]